MDEQQIIGLLANPITLAAILSHILEQTDYFQDETKPPTVKIGIMAIVCVVAAFVLALFSPGGLPTTTAAWREVGSVALLMLVSSQLFHLILKKGFPGLAEFLTMQKTTSVVTVTAAGGTTATATTVQPSTDAASEPTMKAAAEAVRVASPDDPATVPTVLAVEKFLKANDLQLVPRASSPSQGYAPDAIRTTPVSALRPLTPDELTVRALAAELDAADVTLIVPPVLPEAVPTLSAVLDAMRRADKVVRHGKAIDQMILNGQQPALPIAAEDGTVG